MFLKFLLVQVKSQSCFKKFFTVEENEKSSCVLIYKNNDLCKQISHHFNINRNGRAAISMTKMLAQKSKIRQFTSQRQKGIRGIFQSVFLRRHKRNIIQNEEKRRK